MERIGVNLAYLRNGNVGGSETYVRNLLKNLENRFEIFVYCDKEVSRSISGNFFIVPINIMKFTKFDRLRAENISIRRRLEKDCIKLLFSPGNFCPILLPRKIRQVATIHDLQHKDLPKNFSLLTRLTRELFFRTTFKTCDKLISISKFTTYCIKKHYRIDHKKICTIYEGVDQSLVNFKLDKGKTCRKYNINSPYFIYPAMMNHHKNHLAIIEAIGLLKRINCNLTLKIVFCGKETGLKSKLITRAHDLDVLSNIIFLGHIPINDVYQLIGHSISLVFPSLYEGFGLPILEANAIGVPVICSKLEVLSEIASDAAFFVDENNYIDLAMALNRLSSDENIAKNLVKKGKENVVKFSWKKCAEETALLFDKLLII